MADKNPITVKKNPDGTFAFSGRSYNITRDKNRALEPYNCIVSNYGLTLQLLPDEEQAERFRQTFGCVRVVSHDYLEKRIACYNEDKSTLSVSAYKKQYLPELKKERPYLREVDKFALEAAVEHVDHSYQNFFSGRSGFPKFVSKWSPRGNRYTTKQTNDNIALVMENGLPCVKLPKAGKVRFVLPKKQTFADLLPHGTSILSAVVFLDGKNYMVSLSLEAVVEKNEPVQRLEAGSITAADMGIKSFMDMVSDGVHTRIENPRWIRKHEKRLRRFQQSLSRKQYDKDTHTGSQNYYKAKAKVAAEQRKIANQRKDFHHKLSRKIADSCKVFVCEDLNIRGMLKNHHLAKEISSVGWGQFLTFVKYKVERSGGIFLKVSRWFPSSKNCTHCGYHKADLKLSDRYWICPQCHSLIDRDANASDNILKEGIRLLEEQGIAVVRVA